MTGALGTLLLLSAAGSALGLLLMLARRVCGKRLPSTLWYYAWLPVLLRLVLPLPGLIPSAAEESAFAPSLTQTDSAPTRSYRYDGYVSMGAYEYEYEDTDGDGDGTETAAAEAAPAAEATDGDAGTQTSRPHIQLKAVLKAPGFWLAVWLAGAALCFAHYAIGYFRFRRVLLRTLEPVDGPAAEVYKTLAARHRPELFCSAYVKTPMLLGLFHPLIILPKAGFSEATARNILSHELMHYRRGDLYIKWFFVLTASLHWFNPLLPLFRREMNRVCELSCDELVLARMEPSERRGYGETLLDLAASRMLPAGVVATTFATEKQTLKERLEQIIKFKYKPGAILALTIAAMLLMSTVAMAAGPARALSASSGEEAAEQEQDGQSAGSASASSAPDTVNVSTVDELLAAIAPDTQIVLTAGTYDLSEAADYGQETESEYYRWEEGLDGYGLVIENVERLTITAEAGDAAETVISAEPRYADVIALTNCEDITLAGFTAGHTVAQGVCVGGVLHLMGSQTISVSGCALYGCGVLGVEAVNCQDILVTDTDIYECSNGAVWLSGCRSVQFDGCDFRDCYNRHSEEGSPSYRIITVTGCYGVAVTNGHVYGNITQELVTVTSSREVYLLGTLFEDNTADTTFNVTGEPVIVADCAFSDGLTPGEPNAVDMEGNALTADDLAAMTQRKAAFSGFAVPESVEIERVLGEDGLYEVHVSTVDELLAAIAPDTVVYLDEGLFDLTEASNYGAFGSQYYYWQETIDGPGLVISGVDDFSIVGAGKDATRVETLPRYANVFSFVNCTNVSVSALTAGHTLADVGCLGSVLYFYGCKGADVEQCGLFGCGVLGVEAVSCAGIIAKGNEIYECSYGAVQMSQCSDVTFEENDIHDCGYSTYSFYECRSVTLDGEAVEEEYIDIPGAGPYRSAAQG